ncbi:MAG: coproporphyrinogen-III oxidase family protein, partial [Caulobacterales bacterium]
DGFTLERARDFRAAGINRLSLGVQSFDDAALKALGRTHDAAQALAAIDVAQKVFDRASIDLIYARQDQSFADWRRELQQAADTGVRHISAYQLTIEEGTAFAKSYQRGTLRTPANDLAADFYEATQDALDSAGLPAYEISNHAASAEDQSQHNLLYWRSHDWVGVGPGAHGRIAIDSIRHATEACALPADYIAAVASSGTGWSSQEQLAAEEVRAEGILMGVRVGEGLELNRWSVDVARASSFVKDGLAIIEGDRFILTPQGRLLADRIGAELCD